MKAVPPTIVKWQLNNLKPHPQQAKLFPPVSDDELQALADDIQQHGLRQPIEILPDGTIVCGHQRVAAVKLLGRTEIDCIVLHDLVQAGAAAVEQRLIEDNFRRRQLTQLDAARIYRHLKRQRPGKRTGNNTGNLRDEIGKRFNVSGRTLDRWTKVLDADPAVQQAVGQHRLTLAEALKVAALPPQAQQRIALGLSEGKPLQDLLPGPAPAVRRPGPQPEPTIGRLLRQLTRITDRLEQSTLPQVFAVADRKAFNRSRRILSDLQEELVDLPENLLAISSYAPPADLTGPSVLQIAKRLENIP